MRNAARPARDSATPERSQNCCEPVTIPFEAIVKGFYPPLFDREVSPYDWYTNYIASYVERDVRSIVHVKNLGQFQTFLFESFVLAELLKTRYNLGFDPDIHFWRDSSGTEVDVLFEDGPTVKALEIKSGKTFALY